MTRQEKFELLLKTAIKVAKFQWGATATDAYRSKRIAAMDKLRAVVQKIKE